MTLYLLYESSAGYSLFEKLEFDEMNTKITQIQKSISSMEKFSSILRIKVKKKIKKQKCLIFKKKKLYLYLKYK